MGWDKSNKEVDILIDVRIQGRNEDKVQRNVRIKVKGKVKAYKTKRNHIYPQQTSIKHQTIISPKSSGSSVDPINPIKLSRIVDPITSKLQRISPSKPLPIKMII